MIVEIKNWCDKWPMFLNGSKCKVINFGRGNPEREFYISSGRLECIYKQR